MGVISLPVDFNEVLLHFQNICNSVGLSEKC